MEPITASIDAHAALHRAEATIETLKTTHDPAITEALEQLAETIRAVIEAVNLPDF